MRNILFVSHSSELNGAELALLEILRRLDRKKLNLFLVLPCSGPLAEEARRAGVAVSIVPSKWWLTERSKIWKQPLSWLWNRRSVSMICSLIRKNSMSLVFTNSAVNWSGAFAARRTGIPHVWSIHEILSGKKPLLYSFFGRRRLVLKMRKLSKRIIANSEASARAFRGSGEVTVIPNGIGARSDAKEDSAALKAALGLGDRDTALGIVGKIYPGKGQKETILALNLLLPRYPGLKLLVIGEAGDKRYFRILQRIIRKHGLEKNIVFTGYRADVPAILQILKALVAASSVDSFGRAALEAMAAGVPVLAAAKGGLPEIVTHLKTGYLIDSPTADEIAAGLALILDDPALAREIGEAGQKFVEGTFNLDKQVRKMEQVLEECLDG